MRLFSFSASVRTSLISRDKRQIFAFLWKLWTQEKYNFFLYTMGGVCSRTRRTTSDDIGGHTGEGGFTLANGHSNNESGMVYQSRGLPSKIRNSTPSAVADNKSLREPFSFPEVNVVPYGLDDINDGIPRLSRTLSQKSRSTKSRQAVAKVKAPRFYLQLCNLFL